MNATDAAHREIASFKKTGTGRWRSASMQLVNANWNAPSGHSADITIEQCAGTEGGVRALRIDGNLDRANVI